jgi:hypothetical protein
MKDSHSNTHTHLDRALFEGQINSVALTLYENERPPLGLAGVLDWYFQGAISKFLKSGVLTGKTGECSYLPIQIRGKSFNLITIGRGKSTKPGTRSTLEAQEYELLHKNLLSLKVEKVGISQTDFGNLDEAHLSKRLKGVSLWIGP